MYPGHTRFSGPLTAQDIHLIELGINEIICNLMPQEDAREGTLALELPDKLMLYILFVDNAEQRRRLKAGPELGQRLRALLARVEDYYHRNDNEPEE